MTDKQAIESLVATYAESIDKADTDLASTIWDTTGDVVFIHPRGTEYGWEAIKANFYGKTMGDMFTKRELKPRDLSVAVFGDMAVVVFMWEFHATCRADGAPLVTESRETQVMRKTGGKWRIAHVHYSNMPVTGDKQGF